MRCKRLVATTWLAPRDRMVKSRVSRTLSDIDRDQGGQHWYRARRSPFVVGSARWCEMTAQIMDECVHEGETWSVCQTPSATSPPSDELGIRTTGLSTANRTGRVDTYAIADGGLMLATVRATRLELTDRFRGEVVSVEGTESVVRFDLARPVTGWLVLARDLDQSHYVHAGIQGANRFRERLYLRLEEGGVQEERREYGSAADPPLPSTRVGRAGCAGLLVGLTAVFLPIPWRYRIALVLTATVVAFALPVRPTIPSGPTRF